MDKSPPQPAFDIAIDKLTRKGYHITRLSPDSTGATCYLSKRKGAMTTMAQVEWIEDTGEILVHQVD